MNTFAGGFLKEYTPTRFTYASGSTKNLASLRVKREWGTVGKSLTILIAMCFCSAMPH